jgi:hypothetical protein
MIFAEDLIYAHQFCFYTTGKYLKNKPPPFILENQSEIIYKELGFS